MTGATQATVRNSRRFSVSLSTTVASGVSSSSPVQSNAVTGTPVNGTGPFSYAWAVTSLTGTIVATSPTGSTTYFRDSTLSPGDRVTGTAVQTVTDSLGHVAVSQTVDITLRRTIGGGGGGGGGGLTSIP